MKRYDTYKDSGVQWLGEIPGHWGCMPLKRIINKIESGVSVNGSTSQAAVGRELGVLKTGCVSFRVFNPLQNKLVEGEECKRLSCPVKGNTIIVSRMNTPELVGSCAYVEKDYPNLFLPDRLWQVYFNEASSVKFLHWMLNSQFVRNRYAQICVGSSSTMQNISQGQFSDTVIPLPPLPEQHSIVSYLDDKCGKIDKMVEGKQKQIELLAEMKQRIIADAVTRGLNPDVKMKATNIPWLPEIPEHWEFTRNKSLLKLTDEKVGDRKDITLLSLTKQGVIIRDLSEGKGKFPKDFDTYLVVRPNNLVFCLFDVDETPRTVGLVRNYGMLTGAYTNFEVNETLVLPEYIYNYYLQVDNIKGLRPYYTGLRKVVKTGTFLQIRMPLPPLEEQHAIVSYITDKTTKIDTLTAKLQQEIESIKEYKQRLISDVVTGQIKVC